MTKGDSSTFPMLDLRQLGIHSSQSSSTWGHKETTCVNLGSRVSQVCQLWVQSKSSSSTWCPKKVDFVPKESKYVKMVCKLVNVVDLDSKTWKICLLKRCDLTPGAALIARVARSCPELHLMIEIERRQQMMSHGDPSSDHLWKTFVENS